MPFKFFTIPVYDPQTVTDESNAFLSTRRVVTVERQFVADGANSLWSICVSYMDGEGRPEADKRAKKIDYREVLPAAEFAAFSKLRQLRKELAEQEGVQVYAVFTNDQLAKMVSQRVMSLADLKRIDGVGQARLEKYGEAFIRVLRQEIPALPTDASETEAPHEANGHLS